MKMATVTEIISRVIVLKRINNEDWWALKVSVNRNQVDKIGMLAFGDSQKAEELKVGYTFLI